MQPLNTLKYGETYNGKKYRVRDVSPNSIGIIRLSDQWLIRFENTHPSFNTLVKKD